MARLERRRTGTSWIMKLISNSSFLLDTHEPRRTDRLSFFFILKALVRVQNVLFVLENHE